MQRIYNDGKENLAYCIPDDWEKPMKVMNHRSTTRIVNLANAIRSTVDEQKQKARSDADTEDADSVKNTALSKEWFSENEIIIL